MENAVLATPKEKRRHYREQALSRVGETRTNNLGSLMIVDEYNSSTDITVRFVETGNSVKATWQTFLNGAVKNPYDKSRFGVGYLGEGKYKPTLNGVTTPQYLTWSGMLMRCYSEKFQLQHPTYLGCTVADEWLNFQNFAAWYDENYYEIDEGITTHLDKDILIKGNRIYGSQQCCFVPNFINQLFVKRESKRGGLPVGTRRSGKKFEALCNDNKGGRVYLGVYKEPWEAFHCYKIYKEQLIKDVAEENRDRLPAKLYSAMINYKVEIDD